MATTSSYSSCETVTSAFSVFRFSLHNVERLRGSHCAAIHDGTLHAAQHNRMCIAGFGSGKFR